MDDHFSFGGRRGSTEDSDAISKTLNVDQAFVHAHARRLEKQGHIQCTKFDGSIELSLTAAAIAKIATLMRNGKT
jgi:DNA-binding MarR family transcriptional regulator